MTIVDADTDVVIRDELQKGHGVVFWEFSYSTAKARYTAKYGPCDVWYTERNGDPITLLVPSGTPLQELPNEAKGYLILEWIDPDKDFGTGVFPAR